jgi:hypothetical protein
MVSSKSVATTMISGLGEATSLRQHRARRPQHTDFGKACIVFSHFLLLLAVLACTMVELVFDFPFPRAVYAGMVWSILVPLAVARAISSELLSRQTQVVSGAGLLILVALHCIPWSSRKVFLSSFYRIAPGMTYHEVQAIMDEYRIGPGRKWELPGGELYGEDAVVFRHSNLPQYDSDWGLVRFDRQGRVVSSEFLPD